MAAEALVLATEVSGLGEVSVMGDGLVGAGATACTVLDGVGGIVNPVGGVGAASGGVCR